MNRLKNISIFTLMAAVALLLGCKRESGDVVQEPLEANMRIEADIIVKPIDDTKITPSDLVNGGVFELGDQIGVYLIPATPFATTSGFHEKNCNMLFNAQEVMVNTTKENQFVPAEVTKYYKYELHTVFSYYPYQPTEAPLYTATAGQMLLNYKILDDQSNSTVINAKNISNYSLSDLLWAKTENVKPQTNAEAMKVKMTFDHKLANIVVRLTNSGGRAFVGDEAPDASLYNIERAATLNIETGSVTAPQSGKTSVGNSMMKPFTSYVDGTTTIMEFRAVIPPQTLSANQAIFRIRISGVNYEMVHTGADVVLESGKQYVFNVKNTGVDFFMGACEVMPWDVSNIKVTSPGDGLPHRMLFTIDDVNLGKQIKTADLTIDGVVRKSVDAKYDETTKVLTVFYEMTTGFGDKLISYILYDTNGAILKQAQNVNLQILGDPTSETYSYVITTVS